MSVWVRHVYAGGGGVFFFSPPPATQCVAFWRCVRSRFFFYSLLLLFLLFSNCLYTRIRHSILYTWRHDYSMHVSVWVVDRHHSAALNAIRCHIYSDRGREDFRTNTHQPVFAYVSSVSFTCRMYVALEPKRFVGIMCAEVFFSFFAMWMNSNSILDAK